MYIFPTYFVKRNFRNYFLRKFLNALGNKICDVMRDEKFQLEERNTVIIFQRKSHHGCNLQCIWLYILLQKYPRIEFFMEYLLQMLKANDFNRTFVVQFPCPKIKTFLFAPIIL